jgi:hypothetical protein
VDPSAAPSRASRRGPHRAVGHRPDRGGTGDDRPVRGRRRQGPSAATRRQPRSEAARAAGQAISGPQAIQGEDKVVDPAAAVAAAQNYLAAAGVTGTVTVSPDRQHITVTVTIVYTTVFLDLVGIDTLTATRQATAAVVAT